jgi:hypothetical protein
MRTRVRPRDRTNCSETGQGSAAPLWREARAIHPPEYLGQENVAWFALFLALVDIHQLAQHGQRFVARALEAVAPDD